MKVRMTPQRLSWRHGAHEHAMAAQSALIDLVDKAAAGVRALEMHEPDDRAPDSGALHASMFHAMDALRKFESSAASAFALYRQFSADARRDDDEGGE